MKDLVLVDPRAARARLFREAIQLYRQRIRFLHERTAEVPGAAVAQRARTRSLLDALNSVAAARHERLNGCEIRLHVFETRDPALEFLRRQANARPAVVFTDLYLREMSGVTLVEAMRREAGLRTIPTVLLCSDASPLQVREAWVAGSSAVIRVPDEVPGNLLRVTDALEFWFRTAAL